MKEIREIISLLLLKVSKKSATEIAWVALGQTINLFLSFIIIKFISKIGPEQYGIYTLILTIAALLGLFYGSFLQGLLRYYYHYENLNQRSHFVLLMYRFLKITILIFIIITIITSLLSPFQDEFYSSLFLLVSGLFIIISKVSEFFNSVLNLIRKRKENSLLQALEKILMIIVVIILLSKNNLELFSILLAFGCISLFLVFIKIYTFRKYAPIKITETNQTDIQKKMIRTVLIYISPFLIWAIAGWLQMNGEKWIINAILSVKEVGIYAIMIAIVNALVVIPNNIINEYAAPIVFKQFADIDNKENVNTGYSYIKISTLLILIITLIATLLTFLWGDKIITLVSSKNYSTYWEVLPLLALGTGLFYTGQTQTLLGLGLSKPQKYIAPKLIIGIGSVGLNLLFISNFGFLGIAYTILVIGVIYVFYISLVNKRLLKIN
jgi:O-antigen/teichoic acid export membrane protein